MPLASSPSSTRRLPAQCPPRVRLQDLSLAPKLLYQCYVHNADRMPLANGQELQLKGMEFANQVQPQPLPPVM